MSTRAVYTFKENPDSSYTKGMKDEYHVYKHHDGYPTGAAKWLKRAKVLAWKLPRYEADEFAAAFIAANKLPHWCDDQILDGIEKTRKRKNEEITIKVANPYPEFDSGGGVRLLHSGGFQRVQDVAPGDIQYRYEIFQDKNNDLMVKAYSTHYWDDEKKDEFLFGCKLDDMEKHAKTYEKAREDA